MPISIKPATYQYDDTLQNLLSKIPEGSFYLSGEYHVPLSFNQTPFIITSTEIGIAVTINIFRSGITLGRASTSPYVVIMENMTETVLLQLGAGKNSIMAKSSSGSNCEVEVVATPQATLLAAFAKENYQYVYRVIEDLKSNIKSPFSSVLIEHLFKFAPYLPEIYSYRLLCLRMAARALINDSSRNIGGLDFATALVGSTPIIRPAVNEVDSSFDPISSPIYNWQQNFSGSCFHLWFPNICITQWIVFTKFLSNLSNIYELEKVSELEVIVKYCNEFYTHRFTEDFLGEGCSVRSLILGQGCFNTLRVSGASTEELTGRFNVAGYALGNEVIPKGALGARYLLGEQELLGNGDLSTRYESGIVDADKIYREDPFHDGFIGAPLSSRMTERRGLDTLVQKVCDPDSFTIVYPGFQTTLLQQDVLRTVIEVSAPAITVDWNNVYPSVMDPYPKLNPVL